MAFQSNLAVNYSFINPGYDPSMLKKCITGSFYYLRYETHLLQNVFSSSAICIQMIEALKFYSYAETSRFSRALYARDALFQERRATVLAYCLLPQEYHILLRQDSAEGIYQTIKRTHESTTRYYNSLFKRSGRIFNPNTARIEYIYPELQTYTTRQIEELPMIAFQGTWRSYPWSSYHASKRSLLDQSIQIDVVSRSPQRNYHSRG